MTQWLIYAMGGGLGHLQRALALARAAAERTVRCTVVTNSPYVDSVKVAARANPRIAPWFSTVTFSTLPPRVRPNEAAARIEPLLLERPWDAVVVDTFPRGLGGELAPLLPRIRARKIWVHRDISPAYLRQQQIRDRWAPHYDLILAPGERGELSDLAVETPPWLLLPSDAVLDRAAARKTLRCDPDRPLAVVVGAGRDEEIGAMAEWARKLEAAGPQVRLFAPSSPGEPPRWPLLQWLRAADVIVGGGGYNTVHEARQLGIPLRGIARRRMYDRQARRLGPSACDNQQQLLAAVTALLDPLPCPPPLRPYADGAAAAADEISGVAGRRRR